MNGIVRIVMWLGVIWVGLKWRASHSAKPKESLEAIRRRTDQLLRKQAQDAALAEAELAKDKKPRVSAAA